MRRTELVIDGYEWDLKKVETRERKTNWNLVAERNYKAREDVDVCQTALRETLLG